MLENLKNLRIRKENFFAFLLICITFILYYFLNNSNVFFVFNIVIVIWILIKARMSFFSVKIILCNYILIATFFEYNFNTSYGLLHKENNLYFNEMNGLIYIYNIIMLLILINSKIVDLEKKQLKNNFEIPKMAEYFFGIIAVISTLIALPSMPFQEEYDRFNALLPGNAWNHIAIVSLIFLIPNIRSSKFVKIIFGFVIFWFLSHYERVDIIGLIILLIIILYNQKNSKVKFKNIFMLIIIGLLILFTMNFVGEQRSGNSEISFTNLVRKVFIQNTACDVAYVFNSAIDYIYTNDLLLGSSYKTYLIKAIPFLNFDESTDLLLQKKYNTAGGDFFLDEPLMNFGVLGVLIYPFVEVLIYYCILKKQTKYRFFLWAFLIMAVFRTTWYGLYYIEKGIIYFIPIMYFILYYIERNGRKNEKNIDI